MADKFFLGFLKTREWAQRHGYEISKQDYKAGYHKVIIHPAEKFEHFMAKAAVMFMLTRKGRPVVSEMQMTKGGRTIRKYDVFDALLLDRIGIEDTSREKDADVVVKIAEMPMTARKGLAELARFVKERVA